MKRGKIPTKSELLRLQRLYKTDEKIGERLGGVPAYLVAYWRRKKNVPKYSLPKFSEQDIRNLWERYGDDEKAGLELGISKAAFYNWRRRYGFREKPAFLKLEQLEFAFPGLALPAHANSLYGKRTAVQKILARAAATDRVDPGQSIEVEPDLTIAPDGAAGVIKEFLKNEERVWNPSRVVLMPGHSHDEIGGTVVEAHRLVREFARRQGIRAFHDVEEGNCPQVALEKGHLVPGSMTLGVGGQTIGFGAMAGLAIAVNPHDLAAVWAGGKYRLIVPETVRVVISGRRGRGVSAIDIALSVIRQLASEELAGRVIEYTGAAVSQMTMGERYTLAALSTYTGAVGALCAYDATTRRYLTGRTMTRYQPLVPDKDAEYRQLYQINIDHLVPQAAPVDKPIESRAVAEMRDLPVHMVFVGGCMAGRFEDLRVAADIIRGHEVHDGCRLTVVPGSRSVYLEALKKGLIRVYIEAGAIVQHPGSLSGFPLPATGERGLTTFWFGPRLRDGSELFICSPATASASAVNGVITDPAGHGR
ncbi:MAG: aconitase family protein [Candidatus Zixiibacteriota bacterium]